MKIAIHVTETDWEGRVSQNFDIGLSFCFILCRKVFSTVRMRLKLEVFSSSTLLKNCPNIKAKVRVRLKLECGLI